MSGVERTIVAICPHCKKGNRPRGRAFTRALTCSECGNYFMLGAKNEGDYFTINSQTEIHLPIGARGTIDGVVYEVMGVLVKKEKYNYQWREYTLFNPYNGVAYL